MPSRCADRKGEVRVRWLPRPDGLEESVRFVAGYNCTDDSMAGHGVHGMEVQFALRGPAGAVVLVMATDWIPGTLRPGHGLSPEGKRVHRYADGWSCDPRGFGVELHSRRPQYEGHEPAGECELLAGECYCDTHLSGADEPVRRFVAEGEQVIWDELEARYAALAEAGDG
jgi:hypothetical protein